MNQNKRNEKKKKILSWLCELEVVWYCTEKHAENFEGRRTWRKNRGGLLMCSLPIIRIHDGEDSKATLATSSVENIFILNMLKIMFALFCFLLFLFLMCFHINMESIHISKRSNWVSNKKQKSSLEHKMFIWLLIQFNVTSDHGCKRTWTPENLLTAEWYRNVWIDSA